MWDADVELAGDEGCEGLAVRQFVGVVDRRLVEISDQAPGAAWKDDGEREVEAGLGVVVRGAGQHLAAVVDRYHGVVLAHRAAAAVEDLRGDHV